MSYVGDWLLGLRGRLHYVASRRCARQRGCDCTMLAESTESSQGWFRKVSSLGSRY